MGVQVIRTFVGESGKAWEFDVGGQGVGGQESAKRSAVLWVQAQVASTNTADFSLEVGGVAVDGEALTWGPLAGETLVGTNRRYRGGVWATPALPARVTIVCGRAASVMAFVGLVDEPRPVEERRELSVVVRELAAGETHEVRYVRPGELVMKEGGPDGSPVGIDWEKTPFVAHGFVIEG